MIDGRGRACRQRAAAAGCAARAPAGGDRAACTTCCASISRSMRRDGERLAAAGRPLPPLELDSRPRCRLRGASRHLAAAARATAAFSSPALRAGRGGRACGLLAALAADRVRGRDRRLSAGAPAHAAAGAAQAGVEQLGEGDLAARVKVEGKDEIAALAASFNRSAGRIEELMRAHKMLLANARTSCARRSPASTWRLRCRTMTRSAAARAHQGRHRRARPADRGDPAREPARRGPRARAQRGDRSARARSRRSRARRHRRRGHSRDRARRARRCCAG